MTDDLNLECLVDVDVLPDAIGAAVAVYTNAPAPDRLLDVVGVAMALYSRTLDEQIDMSEALAGGIGLPFVLCPRELRQHFRALSRVLDGGQQGAN